MRRRLLAVFGRVALVLPGVAWGHAIALRHLASGTQSRLDAPPRAVVAPFRPVRDHHSAGHRGLHRVPGARCRVPRSPTRLRAPRQRASRRPRAGPGLHGPLAGDIRQTVTPARASSPSVSASHRLAPTDAYGAAGPGWTDDAARWAFFVALALLRRDDRDLRLLVLPRAAPAASLEPPVRRRHGGGHRGAQRRDRCIRDARGRCPPGAVRGSSLRRSLAPRDEDALRGRVHRDDARVRDRDGARPPGVDPGSSGPALARVPRRDRIRDRPVLSGHQGVEPNSTFLTGFADWLHLVAAILSVGGLVALATCVWPLAPDLRRGAFLGFSRIATLLVIVLVLAGTYLSIERLTSVDELDGGVRASARGEGRDRLRRTLMGRGAPFLRPARLERGESPARLRRSLVGESTVAILVLLLAAVLVNARPPAVEPGTGVQATAGH